MPDQFKPKPTDLSPTQRAFADRIFHDIVELLRDDQAVLEIIRGSFPRTNTVERFREDLYAGVANYDLVRTEQLRHTREDLAQLMTTMSSQMWAERHG